MISYKGKEVAENDSLSPEECLFYVQRLVPDALNKARKVLVFPGRWKTINLKLEKIPDLVSELSSHPCFSKNDLCFEQMLAVLKTLNDVIELGELCIEGKYSGKLRMQSDLDALSGRLDLILRDCSRLIKTGVLGEATSRESLLARLQIGHLEAKNRALDCLLELMKDDENRVLDVISRSSVKSLVQLLTATSPRIREKAVMMICSFAESGRYENWLVSEGVLPPLIRLLESSSPVCKQKATISLQSLSDSPETARLIVGNGGISPLLEICQTCDSISQAASACTLKNLSVIPEVRQTLCDEGIVKVMISLLDYGMLSGSKEYAAECLKNLTGTNDSLKRHVLVEGGVKSLLTYLDGPLPQESAVSALRNLVGLVPVNDLISHKVVIRLIHVLEFGSLNAQQSAATAICRICTNTEMKRIVGENGGIPFLVTMLESKSNGVRDVAAQGLCSLMTVSRNSREVKKDDRSVSNLVQLLDPSYENTAKKYAVSCLLLLCSSKKCRKLMVNHGVIGYLKELSEMDVYGAKKLLEKLEKGKFKSLFSKKLAKEMSPDPLEFTVL